MHELLLVSIFISLVLNVFLFIFLYKKRRGREEAEGLEQSNSAGQEPERLRELLESEMHKVERYDEYCFSMVTLIMERYPASLLNELRSFVRQSDSVYMFNEKIYMIFPFLHLDSAFRKKVNERLVVFIQSQHPGIELLKLEAQECNIHEMLRLDEILQ